MSNEPYVLWAKIASIEYVGYKQVYDIEVEGTHNFIANGIFAHNTYMNGNVGIGTTAPGLKLEIAGNSTNGYAAMYLNNTTVTMGQKYYFTSQDSGILQIGLSGGGDSKSLVLNSNGNVGIGTTGPSQKLHVEGQCVTGDTLLPIIRAQKGMDERQIRELWAYFEHRCITNSQQTPKISETRDINTSQSREIELTERTLSGANPSVDGVADFT